MTSSFLPDCGSFWSGPTARNVSFTSKKAAGEPGRGLREPRGYGPPQLGEA